MCLFLSESDDQMHMFELTNQNKIFLEPGHTTSLSLKFVPLKLMPRHCAIILKNKKLGDIVLSVYVTVSLPNPSVPETKVPLIRPLWSIPKPGPSISRHMLAKSLKKRSLSPVIMWHLRMHCLKLANGICHNWRQSNELSQNHSKYAILSTANMVLGRDDDQLEGHENIVFSVEGSDNKYFSFPTEIYLLANSKGKF